MSDELLLLIIVGVPTLGSFILPLLSEISEKARNGAALLMVMLFMVLMLINYRALERWACGPYSTNGLGWSPNHAGPSPTQEVIEPLASSAPRARGAAVEGAGCRGPASGSGPLAGAMEDQTMPTIHELPIEPLTE
jgi:hypothetical protein